MALPEVFWLDNGLVLKSNCIHALINRNAAQPTRESRRTSTTTELSDSMVEVCAALNGQVSKAIGFSLRRVSVSMGVVAFIGVGLVHATSRYN